MSDLSQRLRQHARDVEAQGPEGPPEWVLAFDEAASCIDDLTDKYEHALATERGKLEAADAENDRLAARVAELEKDAARYRWLRHGNDSSILHQPACEIAEGLSGHEWDRAIDTAMGFAAADGEKHGN